MLPPPKNIVGRRFAASFVDALLVTIVFGGLAIAICAFFYDNIRTLPHTLSTAGSIIVLAAIFVLLLGPLLYHASTISSVRQQTFGQRVLGFKTIRMDGMPVSFFKATVRHVVKITIFCFFYAVARMAVDSIASPLIGERPLYLGTATVMLTTLTLTIILTMLPILLTGQHRSFHDLISQTVVVDEKGAAS